KKKKKKKNTPPKKKKKGGGLWGCLLIAIIYWLSIHRVDKIYVI
ncbi:hypothetical protein HMPREF9541_04283, partial [Escherichia coli MS 116-1]